VTAFISHSFDNKPEFDNIIDALAQAGVPYWDPMEIKSGDSLREQLRRAIYSCSVCIFVATGRSVRSSWCGAELGAFWGAGRPIVVYLADSSLADEDLPPIVRGDVWDRRISRVVARAKEFVAQAALDSGEAEIIQHSRVGNMTVEQLQKLIVGAVSLVTAAEVDGPPVSPNGFGEAAMGAAGRVLRGAEVIDLIAHRSTDGWRRQILWVDDHPDDNSFERSAFESMGLKFTLALSTKEALEILSKRRFAAIISDMARKEGCREGYVLLEAIRKRGDRTPFFIYSSSNTPEYKREAIARGAQGSTGKIDELVDLLIQMVS
jgi:CheY-like chemotaxis protein